MAYQTLDELNDSESLCQYCKLDPNTNYSNPNVGYYGCEGSRCNEAYEAYLEDMDISFNVIKEKAKIKITIERG